MMKGDIIHPKRFRAASSRALSGLTIILAGTNGSNEKSAGRKIQLLRVHFFWTLQRRALLSGQVKNCGSPCSLPQPVVRKASHRSEEHTSYLQSRGHLVCRILLDNN